MSSSPEDSFFHRHRYKQARTTGFLFFTFKVFLSELLLGETTGTSPYIDIDIGVYYVYIYIYTYIIHIYVCVYIYIYIYMEDYWVKKDRHTNRVRAKKRRLSDEANTNDI